MSKWFTPKDDQGKPPKPTDKLIQIISINLFVVKAIIIMKKDCAIKPEQQNIFLTIV